MVFAQESVYLGTVLMIAHFVNAVHLALGNYEGVGSRSKNDEIRKVHVELSWQDICVLEACWAR